jgi:uncharacterized protein YdeI (YjbR/CyaY-like superfamily)
MDALKQLEQILTSYPFEIKIKWGGPVYTYQGKNVLGIASFKSYTGIWFYQGALLKDEQKYLVNAQEGKTKAMRQWRFESYEEIQKQEKSIHLYVQEAIQLVVEGKEIKVERNKALPEIPEILAAVLKQNSTLEGQFNALSLGKKREYLEYIHFAKREETKLKRLEKILPLIEAGLGLNDKYK